MSAVNPSNQSSGSTQSHAPACAACKYRRSKCLADCPFAPFFPADKPQDFLNACLLYGIPNMLIFLRSVHPDSRHETMRTIIMESNLRAMDPVGGCYGQIANLTESINAAYTELLNVKQRIKDAKAQLNTTASINPNIPPSSGANYNRQQQAPQRNVSEEECQMGQQQQQQQTMPSESDVRDEYFFYFSSTEGCIPDR